ncbi:hypothetical protein BURPS1655_K0347 [Burkholderia pseudomallei 1655]|nr:hypothetical protein BURPS1655_K0347 [Burkholderia pseudomallei 1655]
MTAMRSHIVAAMIWSGEKRRMVWSRRQPYSSATERLFRHD